MTVYEVPVVIPAYQPDFKLTDLVIELKKKGFSRIVIVNDGSDPSCDPIFDGLRSDHGCDILYHGVNMGKGRALKTAFNHIIINYPDAPGCVTADADGQHKPDDIAALSEALLDNPSSLILGARSFDEKNVPLRSRLGNKITRKVFSYLAGVKITDTQTGLRAIPMEFLKALLNTDGERYEFETNMLIDTKQNDISIREIPIETVYLNNNSSSHFNPFRDSLRIYLSFFKFIGSSLACSALDFLLFTIFCQFLQGVDKLQGTYTFVATVMARPISGVVNFLINHKIVFKSDSNKVSEAPKYILVAVVSMLLSGLLVTVIHNAIGGSETLIKLPVDTLIFFLSYYIQREFVYRGKKHK